MRKLTLIVTVLLFGSCGNQKAEIVEQIKVYKDSSRMVLDSIVKININETLKYEELYFTNGQKDYDKIQNPILKKEYTKYQTNNDSIKWEFKTRQSYLKYKIDSLELELKKY